MEILPSATEELDKAREQLTHVRLDYVKHGQQVRLDKLDEAEAHYLATISPLLSALESEHAEDEKRGETNGQWLTFLHTEKAKRVSGMSDLVSRLIGDASWKNIGQVVLGSGVTLGAHLWTYHGLPLPIGISFELAAQKIVARGVHFKTPENLALSAVVREGARTGNLMGDFFDDLTSEQRLVKHYMRNLYRRRCIKENVYAIGLTVALAGMRAVIN